MPTVVEHAVAIMVGPMISVGLADPAAASTATVVALMRVTDEVLMARNMHMASVAVSLTGLSFCSSCIALSPSGVAASPRPNTLAARFIIIAHSGMFRGHIGEQPYGDRFESSG